MEQDLIEKVKEGFELKIQHVLEGKNTSWNFKNAKPGMLSENQRAVLADYDRVKHSLGVAESSRSLYMAQLKQVGLAITKDWKDIDQNDLVAYFSALKCSESYKASLQRTVKNFFKFLGKEETIKWIKTKSYTKLKKPRQVYTEEDFNKLLNACDNPRNKAILWLYRDTGARASEICYLKIKHVKVDKYGFVISFPKLKVLDGSNFRVLYGKNALANWLNLHLYKNDPEAPLFYSFAKNTYGQPMCYNGVKSIFDHIAKRAGVPNAIIHRFRVTKASELDNKGFSLKEINKIVGWTENSMVALKYIRKNAEQIDLKQLEAFEIIEVNSITKLKTELLKPKPCPNNCVEFVNGIETPILYDAAEKFCRKCNIPLDLEVANKQIVEEQNKFKNMETQMLQMQEAIKNIAVNLQQPMQIQTPQGPMQLSQSGTMWNDGRFTPFNKKIEVEVC